MDLPLDASLTVLSLPLTERFATATGDVETRVVALVRVGDEVAGWGEAAPYPGQDEPIDELLASARGGHASPTLAAALDQAVSDRAARLAGRPLSTPAHSTVPISVAVGIDGAAGRVDAAGDAGARAVKVKVAPGRIDHLPTIRSSHPDLIIGIDGNRSFTDVRDVVDLAIDLDVAYAEELLADDAAGDIVALAEAGIPHFADESIRSVADARDAVESSRFTGLTVKPGRLGWSSAQAVVALARTAGVPWRASGLLETGIGRAYADRLAAEADAFVSDTAPASWFFPSDVTKRPVADGRVRVPEGPGLGVEPDRDAMAQYVVGEWDVRITSMT